MPCRWIGCSIIVSFTSVNRTRSPSVSLMGSGAREYSFPSNDHMYRSMLPVRCSSTSRAGGRRSWVGSSARRSV